MNVRQYKKRYAICEDDNGRMIYPGDTVEVHMPWETHNSHQSRVYWNPLDGAYIDAHPGHRKMDLGSKHRRLRDYIGLAKEKGTPFFDHPDDEEPVVWRKGFCRKVRKTKN
jgi:hypothetical protein